MNSVTSSRNYRDIQAEQEMNEGAAVKNLCEQDTFKISFEVELCDITVYIIYHVYIVILTCRLPV